MEELLREKGRQSRRAIIYRVKPGVGWYMLIQHD